MIICDDRRSPEPEMMISRDVARYVTASSPQLKITHNNGEHSLKTENVLSPPQREISEVQHFFHCDT